MTKCHDGNRCGTTADCVSTFCVKGLCVAQCSTGLVACNGVCIDPMTDNLDCGSCGIACATPSWAHTLTAGTHYWVVVSGYCGDGSGATVGGECPRGVQGGPFAASLSGPGDISAIPEPLSVALAGVALLGLVGTTRKDRRMLLPR